MAELKIPKGNWLFVTGIILVLLGVGSMISPAIAGNAVVYLIGGLLLITGLIQLLAGWQAESWRQKLGSLIHGGIAAVGGLQLWPIHSTDWLRSHLSWRFSLSSKEFGRLSHRFPIDRCLAGLRY